MFSRKLAKWLGNSSKVVGLDRDSGFVEYARQKAKEIRIINVEYFEGDALSLLFEDKSFDAGVSHTVVEHVPNREFLLEQKRVCKDGGRVSVMFSIADKAITSLPEGLPQMTDREKELWKELESYLNEANDKYIKNYWLGFEGMPKLFDDLGFTKTQVDAIALPVVTDDFRNSIEDKKELLSMSKKLHILKLLKWDLK